MSINTDGQKKQGRFLKRGSKLLKAVKMVEFSFEQIRQTSVISFDNPDRSIIHAKFHDSQEIKETVTQHKTFDDVLIDPAHPPMGIIYPADFTQDWHNERMNSKRRALGFEDEDDFDMPFSQPSQARATTPPPKAKSVAPAQTPPTAATSAEPISAQPAKIEAVRAMTDEDGTAKTISPGDMAAAINKTFNHPASNEAQNTPSVLMPTQDGAPNVHDQSADFIPLNTSNANDPRDAEDRAIETWKHKAELKVQSEAMLEQLKQEAKAEGYQEGYRMGEEKGVLAGQNAAAAIFSKVQELIGEFGGLKHLVLENVQKNFYELSQALGEALLEREFSVKPESYAKVLTKIIKDTVPSNEFKIKLHPDTWQKIVNLNVSELQNHLQKDQSVPPGEFKIESNLTVVDVNVKKIISQLLQNVDMELFDSAQKAS